MAQQLVLGYDGTEGAKAALEEAITLCQDLSAVSRAQEAGVTAEARVEAERAAEALVRIAAEKAARMVVVGSHGERPIKGALLGSTPHRLVHLSDTPVLVVRG
jgi:nucleotide-binding universal stress UspA family protein